MREYEELGIDTFIFSGYPHLEEAYRFAELVFPKLTLASQPDRAASYSSAFGPFGMTGGEIVANTTVPGLEMRRAAAAG